MPQATTPRARLAIAAALLAPAALPEGWTPGALSRARSALRGAGPARVELARIERGYYERLPDEPARPDREPPARPARLAFEETPLARPVPDGRGYALVPGLATVHWGVRWTTNARGLRDREYDPIKPPGAARVALIGDSIGAGWGVDDGLAFEALLERAWTDRAASAGDPSPAVEVLNFAVPGLAPAQRWENFRRLGGWSMGVDLVLYQATLADPGWDERRLRALWPRGLGGDVAAYAEVLERAGVAPGLDGEALRRRLRGHREALLDAAYRAIVDDCRSRGVPAAWVLVPRVGRPDDPATRRALLDLARRAGFDAVLDLSDAFEGAEPAGLAIAPDDYHPNAEGHARLARRIDEALSGDAGLGLEHQLGLRRPPDGTPVAGADPR